ncbi:FecR domain-containing protein [Steroidobacter flavus]|uniref:FecR domain-containing protein n=1 Tax=Steroidobacter flavus TaxID=1842136 RepID=A0ABV8T1Q8_9GAMM
MSTTTSLTVSAKAVATGLLVISDHRHSDSIIYRTTSEEFRTAKLEDGTVITLGAESELRVEYTAHARTVRLLAGEALFKVSSDQARPFVVSTFLIDVVHGTNFGVTVGTTVTVAAHEAQVTLLKQRSEREAGGRVVAAEESYRVPIGGTMPSVSTTLAAPMSLTPIVEAHPVYAPHRRSTWSSMPRSIAATKMRRRTLLRARRHRPRLPSVQPRVPVCIPSPQSFRRWHPIACHSPTRLAIHLAVNGPTTISCQFLHTLTPLGNRHRHSKRFQQFARPHAAVAAHRLRRDVRRSHSVPAIAHSGAPPSGLDACASSTAIRLDLEAYRSVARKYHARLKLEELDPTTHDLRPLTLTGMFIEQVGRECAEFMPRVFELSKELQPVAPRRRTPRR